MLANTNPTHPDEIDANTMKRALLAELREDWNLYKACKKLGISRALVYQEWIANDTDFNKEYVEIRESWIDGAEGNIFRQALHNEKSFVPAIFLLKSHRPETYDRQALTGRMTGPVTINIGSVAGSTLDGLLSDNTKHDKDLTGRATASIEDSQASE